MEAQVLKRYSATAELARPEIRLKPSTGRTVFARDKDFGRALKTLQGLVTRNGLARLERQQRFHERPGLKRKRLKSERWRARFKTGFGAFVGRVRELTNQGW
jgi:small subunit ribosomal protein MRP21